MTRFQITFGAIVLTQAAHSVEEYLGRLWESFPPAQFVTGLISQDPKHGFLIINVSLVAFGVWCLLWPVRHAWKGAYGSAWLWVGIELINGIGHPVWSLSQRGYTPGVLTALPLLGLALYMAKQLHSGEPSTALGSKVARTARPDPSNGYEAVSGEFMSRRTRSSVGVATVRAWAGGLPSGADVLDLGCGHGVPISQALVDAGATIHGIDASPSLIAAFRARFPHAPAECRAAEDSEFFNRHYDGVVAWGLIFLLAPDAQAHLLRKLSAALKPGGKLLFTAPREACEWPDNLTERVSVSLGSEKYRQILQGAGLMLLDEAEDEGQNHYYFASRPAGSNGTTLRC